MKTISKILLISVLIAFNTSLLKAQNLVPNPSFEDYIWCPDGLGQSTFSIGWIINVNSTDYFHKCSNTSTGVSVPQNDLGFQISNEGNGYVGLVTYIEPNTGYEEFIGCELIDSLNVGQKYFVSLKVNCAYSNIYNIYCAISNIGVLFTNQLYSDTTQYPPYLVLIQYPSFVNNFAHIYTDSIISDTLNWTVISGSFIADSVYKYMMIGNFFDHLHTDIFCYDSIYGNTSYYYIDDVCVSTDSLECDISSEITKDYINIQPKIYPNPANQFLFIENMLPEKQFDKLMIYNSQGILIDVYYDFKDEYINVKEYNKGIYFISIYSNNQIFTHKIIIN